MGSTAYGHHTSVSTGATLEISDSISIAEELTLNGGIFRSVAGNNIYTGRISNNSNGQILADAGSTLTLIAGNNTIIDNVLSGNTSHTLGGAGNIVVNSPIAFASGSIIKTGSGTVTFNFAGNHGGNVNINEGTLRVSQPTALGSGSFYNASVASGATLALTSSITGKPITLRGEGVSGGGALRNISGNNTIDSRITLAAHTRINSDSGTLHLDVTSGSAITGNFNITFGGSGNITISDVITIGPGTLTKDGSGTLTLDSATSQGATVINAGVLRANHSGALGTTAAGTTVAAGAALELGSGFIQNGAEPLSLSGSGVSSGGALRHISGANTCAGPITLADHARINADAGTLTLDVAIGNAVVSTGNNLTFGGSGNITVADPVSLQTGALIKDGLGTLTLQTGNDYAGGTTVQTGTVRITNTSGTAFGDGPVSIANGATITGSGRFHGALALAGTLDPGVGLGLITLGSESSLNGLTRIEIGGETLGVSYDAIDVRDAADNLGMLTLGGVLQIVLADGWLPTGPASFQIFQASSFGGSFAQLNLPNIGGYEWRTDQLEELGIIGLSAIPEPSSFTALSALTIAGWLGTRRRRAERR